MKDQEIINRLKELEEPWKFDPYIEDHGEGVENMARHIKSLREQIEEGMPKEFYGTLSCPICREYSVDVMRDASGRMRCLKCKAEWTITKEVIK
jgi:hypothetical protein